MKAVPIGVDLNSWLAQPEESLDFIYFGLTFIPEIEEEPEDPDTIEASGMVKLEHNFAPWNDGNGPNNNIGKADLAIIYVSSIFHFDLDLNTEAKDTDEDAAPEDGNLVEEGDFKNESQTWKVGNYLDKDANDLDFVDIAGPGYKMGATEAYAMANASYPATANIIPIAYWEGDHKSHETNVGDEDDTSDDFTTDADVEARWDIMLYAVCYPEFNGTGYGIWHDPTFSVYMVFTPETTGFWALILLIAGVGLIGIATVFIKRRKDKAY
jgi:hypothetical protein